MDGDKKPADGNRQEEGVWQYKTEDPADNFAPSVEAPVNSAQDYDDVVEWSASEFVAHEKGTGWYSSLFLLAILVAAILYLVTRDVVSVVVILFMAVSLAFASARKPKVVNYRVDSTGLTAGNKFYPFRAYKSFVMPEDGPFSSIVLVPLKRFEFPVSAFLAPDSEHKVLDTLSQHLPMERGELDAVDRLMRQLRF